MQTLEPHTASGRFDDDKALTILEETNGFESLQVSAASPVYSKPPPPSPLTTLIGGALSGAAYWFAFYPADTVKSAVQTAEFSSPKHTIWRMMLSIYKQKGTHINRYIAIGFLCVKYECGMRFGAWGA